MSAASGFLTDEQRKLMRSLSHGRDIVSEEKKFTRTVSHGRDIVSEEKKFTRTVSYGQHVMPDMAGSPDKHERSIAKLVPVGSGELKKDRHSHSGRNGRPKKGNFPCGLISEVFHLKQTIPFNILLPARFACRSSVSI